MNYGELRTRVACDDALCVAQCSVVTKAGRWQPMTEPQPSHIRRLSPPILRNDRPILSRYTGLPNTAYFPFSTLSSESLVSDSFPLDASSYSSSSDASSLLAPSTNWFWRLFGSAETTEKITIPKAPSPSDHGLNLSVALQYGPATGLVPLQQFVQNFSASVYKPAYSDFTTLVHTGNTDGWGRVVATLLNPNRGEWKDGDKILAEEWTYPSALASAKPFGIGVVPVGMDSEGMSVESLKAILDGWDMEKDGKKPRVMYTVPVGQNPSGAVSALSFWMFASYAMECGCG